MDKTSFQELSKPFVRIRLLWRRWGAERERGFGDSSQETVFLNVLRLERLCRLVILLCLLARTLFKTKFRSDSQRLQIRSDVEVLTGHEIDLEMPASKWARFRLKINHQAAWKMGFAVTCPSPGSLNRWELTENPTLQAPTRWLFGVGRLIVEAVAVFLHVEHRSYSVSVEP
jgi:hypothetical protein